MANKKSQMSMEYISGYVVVLVLLLVVAAVFWYFGFLRPLGFLPDSCVINPEIECVDVKFGETDSGEGVLRLRLKNKLEEPIIVTSWDVSSETATSFSCLNSPTTGIWLSQEIRNVEFTSCNIADTGFALGDKGKISVEFDYYPSKTGPTYEKQVDGEIFATVTRVQTLLTMPECNDGIDNDGNGCIDWDGGDTGCSTPSDESESGGSCPVSGGGGDDLYCFVSTLCDIGDTIVFRVSFLEDAHAEVPSVGNYNYNVCCRSASDTLSNSCPGQATPLQLSSSTDAHAEKDGLPNYGTDVCLSGTSGTVSCQYRTGGCLAGETCMATISGDTDAHVADCTTQPYANQICCGWST